MRALRTVLSSKGINRFLDTSINLKICRMASAQATQLVKHQQFDYFLVLDFEATCDNTKKLIPQEIIEFPVLKVNPRTLQVESVFHQYVQPKVHRELTPFCVELTGIVQDMVDDQPFIETTLERFHKWMEAEVLASNAAFTFVTCGDWDLKTMLPSQSKHFDIPLQPYFNTWINIKKSFADVTGFFPKGMMPMLRELKLRHVGRHHSGIDDCKNIAAILNGLLQRGYIFQNTTSR